MRTMITNINNRNVYKQDEIKLIMPKKEVSVSLDKSILSILETICKENLGAKRSTVINNLLKTHPEIKKRLKKK